MAKDKVSKTKQAKMEQGVVEKFGMKPRTGDFINLKTGKSEIATVMVPTRNVESKAKNPLNPDPTTIRDGRHMGGGIGYDFSGK